jgi:hypothetical protein
VAVAGERLGAGRGKGVSGSGGNPDANGRKAAGGPAGEVGKVNDASRGIEPMPWRHGFALAGEADGDLPTGFRNAGKLQPMDKSPSAKEGTRLPNGRCRPCLDGFASLPVRKQGKIEYCG